MPDSVAERLSALGLQLPAAAKPAAAYVPYVMTGKLLFISGQLPLDETGLARKGLLGRDVTLEEGQKAAELCALNILAQAGDALNGDFDRLKQIVKLTGFVASTSAFHDHHLVVNGASSLLVSVLGERGKHARAAVGMAVLPLNAAVEIEAIIETG